MWFIVLNRTQVFIASGTRQSFINTVYYDNLSVFASHFATQIFPIDELLKPYNICCALIVFIQ
jgi:hypothetical protein